MLSDVITAVAADMTAAGVVLSEPVLFGNQTPNFHGAPPRIAVVPTFDTYGPTHHLGGNQRSIHTRTCNAEVHLWTATVATMDALLNQLILSIYNVVRGEKSIGRGRWSNDTTIERRGFGYVLEFSANIPITDSPYVNAPSDVGFEHEGKMIFANSEVIACGP